MSYKDEIVKRLEKIGIEVNKDQRTDIRPKSGEIINELLDRLENTTTNTTKTTIDTTKIEKPTILSPTEEQILNFIKEEAKRFKEIKNEFNLRDGNAYNYLKSLLDKGLIQKKAFSHKNVVYY